MLAAVPRVAPRRPMQPRVDALVTAAIRRRDAMVLPPVRYPRHLEREYRTKLLRVVAAIHKDLARKLRPVLDRIESEVDERHEEIVSEHRSRGQRGDSARSNIASVIAVIEEVRRTWRDPAITDEYLETLARGADAYATEQIDQKIRQVIGVDLFKSPAAAVRYAAFARENASLITSIQTQYLDQVASKAREALRTGSSTRQLRMEIEDRYGVARSRANLIAMDQLGKLNGQITQERQTELGLDSYQWSTSGDERVRQRHHELDGKIFKWSDPPVTNPQGDRNHPGGDFQCRCQAESVLADDNIRELIEAGTQRKSVTELRREKAVAEGRPVAPWRKAS